MVNVNMRYRIYGTGRGTVCTVPTYGYYASVEPPPLIGTLPRLPTLSINLTNI